MILSPFSGVAFESDTPVTDTVLTTTDGGRIRQASWPPNGAWLAATVIDTAGKASLRLFARDGSSANTLLPQRVLEPTWSGAGDAVYLVGDVDGVQWIHLIHIDPRTGNGIGRAQSVMTGMDIEDFDVAEDGSIAYAMHRRRENILSLVPGERRVSEQLTRGTAPISAPALDADGKNARQITTLDGQISALRWAPRHPNLAFILEAPSERVLVVVSA